MIVIVTNTTHSRIDCCRQYFVCYCVCISFFQIFNMDNKIKSPNIIYLFFKKNIEPVIIEIKFVFTTKVSREIIR
jgi:hypothetical protein